MSLLQLVVPCYNEAARLRPDAFLEFAASHSEIDLLFVDDGSTDATPAILAAIVASGGGHISLLSMNRNCGKAEAVRQGVLTAIERNATFVGFWDADLSTSLQEVPRFLDVLTADPDVDIVMGARVKLMGRDIRRGLLRHYAGRIFATAASLALGIAVYDTQCGAKIFRVNDRLRPMFGEPFASRWTFDLDILSRYLAHTGVHRAASRIYEIPLERWSDVPGSKLRPRDAVRAGWDLARLVGRRARPR